MSSSLPDQKVFDWLGYSSVGSPRHLYALHPRGPDDRHELQALRSVAERLSTEPEYWSQIIRTAGWRSTLIGGTCVLIARPDDRFEDLLYRFERGSFVSPQLSIAIGMVYPNFAVDSLNSFLDNVSYERVGHKEIISAQSVLRKLGTPRSNPLKTDSLEPRAHHDAEFVEQLIEKQWAFWTRYHHEK